MGKGPLDIDWKEMLPGIEDGPPPEVQVIASGPSDFSEVAKLSDRELQDRIQRVEKHLYSEIGSRLTDNGAKLKASLSQMLEELNRRKRARDAKAAARGNRVTRLKNTKPSGTVIDVREIDDRTTPQSLSQPSFTSKFMEKLEKADVAFNEELKIISQDKNRGSGKNESQKHERGHQIAISSQQARFSSRKTPFKCFGSYSRKDQQRSLSSDSGNFCSSSLLEEQFYFNRKRTRASDTKGRNSVALKLKKVSDVVLLDEEETYSAQSTEDDSKKWKAGKVYYPSRSDPKAVELSFTDIKCLDPESYLSSTIMNFYIRYLQDRPREEYYFFNTYFYKKLEEAVSLKATKACFEKLRRWWKGVNIFQKSYIFIPVHGEMHWSLVIICIPVKEDESGPIVLHLDSLGIHDSYLIFSVIDRYLKEEWNYLNQNSAQPDLPISEKMWRHLSRRIEKKKIMVPQQKNAYDCGLFVLYFMKRFIEEAPERLRRKDLSMFGSKWFQPEDASGLRKQIRDLLLELIPSANHLNNKAESACSCDSSEDDRLQQFEHQPV
ncbi:hypothetical protein Cni_G21269 [Canna indica]|uniref:Ubiquitin-like protease family profile domain-containing protein n=1 Tax=Canna indica TaxID=4628 RepID=A0AAQ3KRT8_9LILI|nr:hypothetical protein Cni_G21269 [Canna indica]